MKQWTKILYDSFTVKIQNNGHFSDQISIQKGVHQGGCCSSIYFLVIAEILALSLRSNESIDGITLKDIRNLLNQFADDMDIFSLCNQKSIMAIKTELDLFQKQSGFTVSYVKTTLYRIGSLRHSDAQLYNLSEFAWSNKDISVLGITISHEELLQKNYKSIVTKAKQTLSSWQNRGLSLLGKVQVVNTLVSSLFVYKMMVLPIIPKAVVKNVDNLIREFLWNGKKSKIAYTTLQNPKEEGGLNLVNLVKKDQSLKATWPMILHSEKEYGKLVYQMIKAATLGEDIWRCSLKPEHVDKLNIRNDFWVDVLKSWGMFNCYYNKRVENQLIWYNSSILVNGKPILWSDAYLKGLKYVHQLFEGMRFKSDLQIKQEFGLTTLRYNSLKVAIPLDWRNYFCSTVPSVYMPIPPHNYDLCTIGCLTQMSSKIYRFIADDAMIIHNKYIKWRLETKGNFCETLIDFALAHKHIYALTNVPKYRSFQYRLLQRGLVTNVQLYKWKIIESDACYFCKQSSEDLSHLMYFCPIVQELWAQMHQYLESQQYGLPVVINLHNVLLNRIVEKKKPCSQLYLPSNKAIYLCTKMSKKGTYI